ncbi:hypothetical protein LOTGIDRAFT_165370 [Lottia gigantea]|uniref:Uncharacterized protein n=1 Tax=Lottia gigantea TaxID=225164 RepID=V3ZW36_LOTGI|nr:hypothetical protein LOTGIDRAFT_165370 [Lottia gigantea]ESO88587.1 hypothetical protein LOTGIDRAFT_165370 [Lottia gigantea]
MDRDAFKKVCKGQWRNQDEHGYVFLNTKKPAEMSNDWNNILKRNKEYIQAKNKVKTQVEIIRLQQLGLTENLQTQPILKSQEDIKKRLIPPKEPIRPVEPHHPEPNPYGAGTIAGAAAGGVGVANAKKAAIAEAAAKKATDEKNAAEERRHNLKMEKLAAEVEKPKTEKKGSGVGEMIGTMKEFGKSEETKKTVKQGLNKLEDSIDTGEIKVKHKAAIRITKTVLSKKADDAKAAEERTHNLALEKKA